MPRVMALAVMCTAPCYAITTCGTSSGVRERIHAGLQQVLSRLCAAAGVIRMDFGNASTPYLCACKELWAPRPAVAAGVPSTKMPSSHQPTGDGRVLLSTKMPSSHQPTGVVVPPPGLESGDHGLAESLLGGVRIERGTRHHSVSVTLPSPLSPVPLPPGLLAAEPAAENEPEIPVGVGGPPTTTPLHPVWPPPPTALLPVSCRCPPPWAARASSLCSWANRTTPLPLPPGGAREAVLFP